jgi:NADH:ubiquinone oxidoreductase subunit 3 (subunit A)
MNNLLLTPLIAFVIYLAVVGGVSALGRIFAAKGTKSDFKTSSYAGGEEHDPYAAAPGYRQFFVVALFFAVLHLGVLMIGSSNLAPVAGIYLLGLALVLIALILG